MTKGGKTNNGANRCERWPGHTAWQRHRAAHRKARRQSQKSDLAREKDHSGRKAGLRGRGAAGRHGRAVPTRERRAAARARRSQRKSDGAGRCHAPSGPKARRPHIGAGQTSAATQAHTKAVTDARHRIDERKGREREQRPGPRRPSQRGRRSGAVQHPAWGAGGANTDGIPQGRPAGIRNTETVTGARHRIDERKGREREQRPGPRRPS